MAPRLLPLSLLVASAALPAHAGIFHPASRPDLALPTRWLVLFGPAVRPSQAGAVADELLGRRGRVERVWSSALTGALVTTSIETARALAAEPRVAGVYQDLVLEDPFSSPLPDCSLGVATTGPSPNPPSPETITCVDPDPQNLTATCTDNWGLDRLDGTSATRDGAYAPPRNGSGVHIFLVDSGLYAQHQEFVGRVGLGTDATGGGGTPDDCGAWSHGTHVAGIAGGARFGVAKGTTLHPVRVSSCPINIAYSSLVTAFDWIAQAHASSVPGPAVATMSINSATAEFTGATQPLGVAVTGVLNAGVQVMESAGNNLGDACGHVLGAPGVLIVGGSDEFDTPWERRPGDPNYGLWCGTDCGSNTGSCVSLFAPAAHIVSSWLGSTPDPANMCRLSGTSMAAPHAAGTAALFLQANPSATPAQVRQALLAHAQPTLTQLPAGSPNAMLSVLEGVPGMTVAPAAGLSFGAVGVTQTSAAQTVTVTSAGTLGLTLGTAALSGAQATDFALARDGCSGKTVPPAGTCTLDVTFTPLDGGARVATLTLPSNDPAHAQTAVPLSGEGEPPRLTVTRLGTGTVRSLPAGIDCGATCEGSFAPGSAVTLTAEAAQGWSFSGWSGVACDAGPCALTVLGVQAVTATFVARPSAADAGTTPRADGGADELSTVTGYASCGCSTEGAMPLAGAALAFVASRLARRRRGANVSRRPAR